MAKKKKGQKKQTKSNPPPVMDSTSPNTIKETTEQPTKKSWLTWDTMLVGALVLFVLMVRIKLLGIPLERDDGGFSYLAFQMLEGKDLYADLYDIKLPFLYILFASFITLFGNSVEGIHTGLVVFDIAYIVTLFLFCRYFFDRTIALVATFAFAILSLGPNLLGFASHATHFAILPGLIGLYTLTKAIETERKVLFLLAGLACGSAFLVKQQAVHFMLFAGFYTIFAFFRHYPKVNWKDWFISEVYLVIGSIAPYVMIVLYFFAKGNFEDFWFYTVVWPTEYATSAQTGANMDIIKMQVDRVIQNQELLWYLAGGGIVSMFLVQIENKWRVFVLLLGIFMTFGLATGFHFYQHYFVVLIPVVAMLNGMFVRNVGKFINNIMGVKWGLYIPLALFVMAWTQVIRYDSDYFFNPDHTQILRNAYGSNPFPESKVIGDYIRDYTQPEDKIVIACSEPQIGFYAQRMNVSGQIFTYTLVDNGNYMTQLQDEFIEAIQTQIPKISVYTWMGTSWLNKDASGRVFKAIEENHNKYYNLIGVAECVPTRQVVGGPIIWNTNYKWQQEAVQYYNQRMNSWQANNEQLVKAGKQGNPPPNLLTVWERKPEVQVPVSQPSGE
jgi:hypothetical protein